ncbi:MAG: DUF2867 domain-containing protein [Thermoleophilaceae bacterium]
MRLPKSAHISQPWRIHEIAPDFRLEDVWELPAQLGPEDFPRFAQRFASFDTAASSSRAVRAMFAIRWKVGGWLGWDDPDTGVGTRVPTLRDRLPADLTGTPGPEFAALPFTSLYLTDDEWAAEVANGTMHGIAHLGRIPDRPDTYRVQMAVLVKPNGRFGNAYMAAIKPFRHLIVYPKLIRDIGRISKDLNV